MVAVNIKRDSINDILTLVLLPTHSKKKYIFFGHKKNNHRNGCCIMKIVLCIETISFFFVYFVVGFVFINE